MQRRGGIENPTDAPGRTAIADLLCAHGELTTVRDVVLAGGVLHMTAKEMFDER